METEEQSAAERGLMREDWAQGACWLDNDRFLLGAISAEPSSPYALLYDLKHAQISFVRGPHGAFYMSRKGLLSANEKGLSLWDEKSWLRLAYLENFQAHAFHDDRQEVCTFQQNEIRLLEI